MSINGTLSTLGSCSLEVMKFVTAGGLANPKITALAIGILSSASCLPIVSAGPAVQIGCMAICSIAAMVHPAAAIYWPQCMTFCELTGFAPTP